MEFRRRIRANGGAPCASATSITTARTLHRVGPRRWSRALGGNGEEHNSFQQWTNWINLEPVTAYSELTAKGAKIRQRDELPTTHSRKQKMTHFTPWRPSMSCSAQLDLDGAAINEQLD